MASTDSHPQPAPEFDPRTVTIDKSVGKMGMALMETPRGLVVVRQITPKGWAHKQGIRPGDLIVRVNGDELKKIVDIGEILGATPRPFDVVFLRMSKVEATMGSAQYVRVSLAARKPHPLFEVFVSSGPGAEGAVGGGRRFADFARLRRELLKDAKASPYIKKMAFPSRYASSKFGFSLSSKALEKRRVGLEAWMKVMMAAVQTLSPEGQAKWQAFLGGTFFGEGTEDVAEEEADGDDGFDDGALAGGRFRSPPLTQAEEEEREEEEALLRETLAVEAQMATENEDVRRMEAGVSAWNAQGERAGGVRTAPLAAAPRNKGVAADRVLSVAEQERLRLNTPQVDEQAALEEDPNLMSAAEAAAAKKRSDLFAKKPFGGGGGGDDDDDDDDGSAFVSCVAPAEEAAQVASENRGRAFTPAAARAEKLAAQDEAGGEEAQDEERAAAAAAAAAKGNAAALAAGQSRAAMVALYEAENPTKVRGPSLVHLFTILGFLKLFEI